MCFLHPAQRSGNQQLSSEGLVRYTEGTAQEQEKKNLVRGLIYKVVILDSKDEAEEVLHFTYCMY